MSRPQLLAAATRLVRMEKTQFDLASARRMDRRELLDTMHELARKIPLLDNGYLITMQPAHSQFGYLILERMVCEPIGTEASAEVVRSQFLGPGAEVQLTRKTWSKVETEFVDAVDRLREEEREGATSSTRELSESSQKQSQYSASLSATAQMSGDIGLYKASANASTTLQTARSATGTDSAKHLQNTTGKAAARSRQEHKVTYTQRSSFSSEYVTTETIKNPNSTHAVVLTVRKLVQKWRMRHEHYGIRLCLDVMIRNPRRNLRPLLLPEEFDEATVPDPNPSSHPKNPPPIPPSSLPNQKSLLFPPGKNPKWVPFLISRGLHW